MDVHCVVCGEPWDTDTLHEVVAEGLHPDWESARRAFFQVGCRAIEPDGADWCVESPRDLRANVSRIAAELLGDDVDGIASLMDDMGALGLFD